MPFELSSISQKGFEQDHRLAVSFRHYCQTSTSNWGTREPPVIDTHRASTDTGGPEKPVGRQTGEPTSTTKFDTEAGTDKQNQGPKKSRTGGDMTDEGQVHTPNLHKMRSTRDIIQNAGKEQEERLASKKKSSV